MILDEITVRVSNLGGGTLEVQTSVAETDSGGNWLAAELTGEDLEVTVDRSGLADGRYEGRIQLSSNGGNGTVEVKMQVGVDESSNIGDIFVLAIDPRTLEVAGQSSGPAMFEFGYEYEMSPFPSGDYLILGGTDNDDDGFICDEGEFCGTFPVSNQPVPVTVEPGVDTPGIDFTVEVEGELSALSTGTSARRNSGFRISPRPAMGRLLEKLKNGRLPGKGNERHR